MPTSELQSRAPSPRNEKTIRKKSISLSALTSASRTTGWRLDATDEFIVCLTILRRDDILKTAVSNNRTDIYQSVEW